MKEQLWHISSRSDLPALKLADRHYSRQNIGSKGFVPPGRCIVFLTEQFDAVWATSWPYAHLQFHGVGDAWVCTMFRNEGEILSSKLITQAVAATRWVWPCVPDQGMITYVDPTKIRSTYHSGQCFRAAGFKQIGETKKGLLMYQMKRHDMPNARRPTMDRRQLIESQCRNNLQDHSLRHMFPQLRYWS